MDEIQNERYLNIEERIVPSIQTNKQRNNLQYLKGKKERGGRDLNY